MTTKEDIPLRQVVADTALVLRAAYALTRDRSRALDWFHFVPIAELDKLTARQLVERGNVQAVLDYISNRSVGSTG